MTGAKRQGVWGNGGFGLMLLIHVENYCCVFITCPHIMYTCCVFTGIQAQRQHGNLAREFGLGILGLREVNVVNVWSTGS